LYEAYLLALLCFAGGRRKATLNPRSKAKQAFIRMSIFSAENFLNWVQIWIEEQVPHVERSQILWQVLFQVIDFLYLLLYPRTKGASETEYQIDLAAFASANLPVFFSARLASYMFCMWQKYLTHVPTPILYELAKCNLDRN